MDGRKISKLKEPSSPRQHLPGSHTKHQEGCFKTIIASFPLMKREERIMKTYFRDFSIEGTTLVKSCSQFEEIIINRQEKFMRTVEYQELDEKVMTALGELENLLPEHHRIIGRIRDDFFSIECRCYSAAYRDGTSDLITAMSFNELGITKVEYCDLSSKGIKVSRY